MSNEEFERTREVVAEFGKPGGMGEELQRRLLERAKTRESWVSIILCRTMTTTSVAMTDIIFIINVHHGIVYDLRLSSCSVCICS